MMIPNWWQFVTEDGTGRLGNENYDDANFQPQSPTLVGHQRHRTWRVWSKHGGNGDSNINIISSLLHLRKARTGNIFHFSKGGGVRMSQREMQRNATSANISHLRYQHQQRDCLCRYSNEAHSFKFRSEYQIIHLQGLCLLSSVWAWNFVS